MRGGLVASRLAPRGRRAPSMPMESPSALMVTGHRELSHPELVAERLDEVLARLAPTVAISGGAQGADSLFASVALARGVPLRVCTRIRVQVGRAVRR